jgi:hypothetical protein
VVVTAILVAMNEPDKALEALARSHADFARAEEQRYESILAASEAGCTLRQIEAAVERSLSHEKIRKIVGPRTGVVFRWRGRDYPISEPGTRALIHKAEGNGRGAFPGDIEKYGLGTDWLPAAAELGAAMQRVYVGLDPETIELDEPRARAMCQILRLTYMDALTPIADLRHALMAAFPDMLERR